jgi:thiamine-monophosphate kinase
MKPIHLARSHVTDTRSEFAFINWVRLRLPACPGVPIGIGDDAALFRVGDAAECLITVDMLMDGVDFHLHGTEPSEIGRKALAVSLSDIAAMAGKPTAAVVALALPKAHGRQLAERVHSGIHALASEFQVAIVGGDTNSWDGPLVICCTVVGTPTARGPVRRNGAQAGDWILVTGDLGGSILGKHLSFQPRVREAIVLHQAADLHAMIDISDGLAADLHHLLEESGMGATIRAAELPISEAAQRIDDLRSPVEHALADGEDFELLFTVSPHDGRRLCAHPPCAVRLSHIGEITAERSCTLVATDGKGVPLPPMGWVHSLADESGEESTG